MKMSRFSRTLLACAIVFTIFEVGDVLVSALYMGFELKNYGEWLKFIALGTVFGLLYTLGMGLLISGVVAIIDEVLDDDER